MALKSLLNVNCIKIKNAKFNQITSSLYVHADMAKGQKSHCLICGRKCNGYDSVTEQRF